MIESTSVDDSVFADAVHKVAPSNWNRYTKILEGMQARAVLAERERDEMAAELAEIKQRKTRATTLTLDFYCRQLHLHGDPTDECFMLNQAARLWWLTSTWPGWSQV